MLISGLAMVTMANSGTRGQFITAAIFFGIGAALVLDEFALILHLEDVYWTEDGRTSVDAVFVAVAVADCWCSASTRSPSSTCICGPTPTRPWPRPR